MSTPNEPQNPFEKNQPQEGGAGTPESGTPGTPQYPAAPQYPSGDAPQYPAATPQYPSAPGYPAASGYPAAPQYDVAGYSAPPNNYLVWAILSTVLCCLPLGVVSIVFSTQVNTKWNAGDFDGARASANRAKLWAIWSAVAALVATVGYVILLVVGALALPDTTTY